MLPGPHKAVQDDLAVVHGVRVGLFRSEVPQVAQEHLLEDVKPLQVHSEVGKPGHDLGQKRGLLVVVATDRHLRKSSAKSSSFTQE